MGDIHCNICGEPWDTYEVEHTDTFTEQERRLFFDGKGCPHCKFPKRSERKVQLCSDFLESLLDNTDDPDLFLY